MKEDILNKEPGPEMDLLVTEKVMGWIAWEEQRGDYKYIVFQKPGEREPYRKSRNWENEMKRYRIIKYSEIDRMEHIVTGVKDYSTDIAAAFEMESKIDKMDFKMKFAYIEYMRKAQGWDTDLVGPGIMYQLIRATPEERCKAALLAVWEETQ